MEIEKTNRMNALFEFYSTLLTEKQMNYMELYYADDFSLGEIAEEYQVSRQAVYDNIKRTERILEDYEKTTYVFGLYHAGRLAGSAKRVYENPLSKRRNLTGVYSTAPRN